MNAFTKNQPKPECVQQQFPSHRHKRVASATAALKYLLGEIALALFVLKTASKSPELIHKLFFTDNPI